MKTNDFLDDFMQPLLCNEERSLWMDKYSFVTSKYTYKLSIQNHPSPGTNPTRNSWIGITIKVLDDDNVDLIIIKQLDPKNGGAAFYRDEKRILVHYNRGDINNIIMDLKSNSPLFVVYGQFSKESNYPEKTYVAIENPPHDWLISRHK